MAKNYREIAKKFGRNFRNPNLLKDGAASFESWRQRRVRLPISLGLQLQCLLSLHPVYETDE